MRRFYQAAVAILALVAGAASADPIPGITFTQIPIPSPRTINPYSIAAGSGGRIWFADRSFRQVGFFGADNSIQTFKLTPVFRTCGLRELEVQAPSRRLTRLPATALQIPGVA